MEATCSKCYAQVREAAAGSRCPACGSELIAAPNLDPPGAPPATLDHRGILLPRRHAVGGIITPR